MALISQTYTDLTNRFKVRVVSPGLTENYCFLSPKLRNEFMQRVRAITDKSGVESHSNVSSWVKPSRGQGVFLSHKGPNTNFNVPKYLGMSSGVIEELRNVKTQGNLIIDFAESTGVIQKNSHIVLDDLKYTFLVHPQIGKLTQSTIKELFTDTHGMGPKRVDILLSAIRNNGFYFSDKDNIDSNKLLLDRENGSPIEI